MSDLINRADAIEAVKETMKNCCPNCGAKMKGESNDRHHQDL